MTPFAAALVLPPVVCSAVAWIVARGFAFARPWQKRAAMFGAILGLVLLPLCAVTVGTIGGGFWAARGLPGGPLTGVLLAITFASATTTGLAVTTALLVAKAALVMKATKAR